MDAEVIPAGTWTFLKATTVWSVADGGMLAVLASNEREEFARRRDAPSEGARPWNEPWIAPTVKLSEEMTEAGIEELSEFRLLDDARNLVRLIYCAMEYARRQSLEKPASLLDKGSDIDKDE